MSNTNITADTSNTTNNPIFNINEADASMKQ